MLSQAYRFRRCRPEDGGALARTNATPARRAPCRRSCARATRNIRLANDRRAFTLIELLVVVAVIGILLGIMLPSLGAARARARETTCASRLRQWGIAFACYANENRAYWPHCDGLDRGPRDLHDPHISREDLADWFGWVDVLPPMLGLKPWRDHPLYQRPDQATFFQCPFGVPLEGRRTYSYRPERSGWFSYAMNSCLELDRNAWAPPGGVGYPMPSFLDTGKIRSPSLVIVLFDQLLDPDKGYNGQQVNRSAGKHCGSYPKAFAARHPRGGSKLGGNLLLADGHAKWQESVWKDDWDPDLEVPPRDDVNWYPYPVVGY